jgi:dTMP kinase
VLIEIAGIDGAGKSTLVAALAEDGFAPVKVAPFDAGFWRAAETVRSTLGLRALEAYKGAAIARALVEAGAEVPEGDVVFDRYLYGAQMYWAVKALGPVPADVLDTLPQPDAVILLDVPAEQGLTRRGRASEESETAELEYLERCANWLRDRAHQLGWDVIDATRPIADVIAGARGVIGVGMR